MRKAEAQRNSKTLCAPPRRVHLMPRAERVIE
jgi:hypothetical protein